LPGRSFRLTLPAGFLRFNVQQPVTLTGQTEDEAMGGRQATWRRAAAAIVMALGLVTGGAEANWKESPFVKGRLVQVDVYDRTDGLALPVYAKNGQSYIVGTPGHEYAVRIRNCTGGRVVVVTSVDGVNVVSGETAAPTQTGYVLDPWGSVEIAGWRKSMDRTAAFYFTDLGDSYAARTGRPQNVGVVGVAVFQETPQPIVWPDFMKRLGAAGRVDAPASSDANGAAAASTARQVGATDSVAQPAPAAPRERSELAADDSRARDSVESAPKTLGKLGTGHGRSEDSPATTVAFQRASHTPAETLAVQYDRRENLVAMGVLPPPYYARRQQPDPFPGAMRFAPDPR
jgi:hypothetical protein